jgi:hypothetical protein
VLSSGQGAQITINDTRPDKPACSWRCFGVHPRVAMTILRHSGINLTMEI